MSKKIIGLLLVLCMVVGLLPVVALADATDGKATFQFGAHKYTTTGFDKPIYIKSVEKAMKDVEGNAFTGYVPTAGNADDWNAKWEWKSGDKGPTLTLNGFKYDEWNNDTNKMCATFSGEDYTTTEMQTYAITLPKALPEATIVITGEDSLLNCSFGITYYCPLTVKSEGNAKLTIDSKRSGITSNDTKNVPLTLNANLDIKVRTYYNGAFSHMIQTTDADLTINGGNIKARSLEDKNFLVAIFARGSSGNVIINGGKIDVDSTVGTAHTNGTIQAAGKIIINDGDVTTQPKKATGLYGKTGIEINGGKVKVISPYYGVNAGTSEAPAEILLNGGTLEIMAEKAFWTAPKIGPKVEAYAGANRENCEIFDGSDAQLRYKPWFLASDTERIEITEPEEEEMPIFTGAAPTTPAGTTAPTQAPAGSDATTTPTAGADKTDSDSGSNNNTVLLIVAIAIVVIAGAVVAVIVIKRKKAK